MVKHRSEAGVTLIELLCAMAVLGVLATGVMQGGRAQSAAVIDGFCETTALRAVQSAMETMRARPSGAMRVGVEELQLSSEVASRLRGARGRTVVRELPDSGAALLEIEAELWWTPVGSKSERSVRLTTLRAVEEKR